MQARILLRKAPSMRLPLETAQVYVHPCMYPAVWGEHESEDRASSHGKSPQDRLVFHLPGAGKEGKVGNRAQSLTPISFLVTSQLGTKEGYLIKQGKIVKVRKTLTPRFHYAGIAVAVEAQKLETIQSWNSSTCILLQRRTICVPSNNKARL